MLCHLCFELMLRPHTKPPLYPSSLHVSIISIFSSYAPPPLSLLHPQFFLLLVIFWAFYLLSPSLSCLMSSVPLCPHLPFLSKHLAGMGVGVYDTWMQICQGDLDLLMFPDQKGLVLVVVARFQGCEVLSCACDM